MASRMAVPPRESILLSACSISRTSLVKSQSRKASSLKLTTKASSSRFRSDGLAHGGAAARVDLTQRLLHFSNVAGEVAIQKSVIIEINDESFIIAIQI